MFHFVAVGRGGEERGGAGCVSAPKKRKKKKKERKEMQPTITELSPRSCPAYLSFEVVMSGAELRLGILHSHDDARDV